MKIKKGDKVVVIAGKDRGKSGSVLVALPKKGAVVVEGVNMRKRHRKPRKKGEKGTIVERPSRIDISNVQIADPKSGKGTRIKMKRINGKPVRVTKKSASELK